jgi:hypothetical protein
LSLLSDQTIAFYLVVMKTIHERSLQWIEESKRQFETRPETWRSFGKDLVDAGSPFPCNRSPIARKVLCGRWQEAYQDWLKAGEFSRESEETMLAFILATEVTFHRRPPVPAVEMPKRIWDEVEFQKSLRHTKDVDYWKQVLSHLQRRGPTDSYLERNGLAELLAANKPKEAEVYYRLHDMDQSSFGEEELAMIRNCSNAHGVDREEARARKPVWFFKDGCNRARGPLSEIELKAAMDQGRLMRTVYVWTEGMGGWEQASQLDQFQIERYVGPIPPE